jgi:hypothetical protein
LSPEGPTAAKDISTGRLPQNRHGTASRRANEVPLMTTKVSRARFQSYLLIELADLNAKETRAFAHVRPNQPARQFAPMVRRPTDANWSRGCPWRHKAVSGKFIQIELQPIFKTHAPAVFWHFNPICSFASEFSCEKN